VIVQGIAWQLVGIARAVKEEMNLLTEAAYKGHKLERVK